MRVLLAEDEPDLGKAIKRILTQETYVVDWVQSGDEALVFLTQDAAVYSLAVFEWALPGVTGIELCEWLRSHHHALPVLMLTAKDKIEDRITGLDSGADDYLIKPFSTAELLARLRALSRRVPEFESPKIRIGPLLLDCDRRVAVLHPEATAQLIDLTQKEFLLLRYLMEHPSQILTRDQVLNQLWEFGGEPSSNVVAAQMRLLRRKLGASAIPNSRLRTFCHSRNAFRRSDSKWIVKI
ncbi:MAG: two-component system response regulator RppA [Phormidesmis sp.]